VRAGALGCDGDFLFLVFGDEAVGDFRAFCVEDGLESVSEGRPGLHGLEAKVN
jgi:hypothetical protein